VTQHRGLLKQASLQHFTKQCGDITHLTGFLMTVL